MQSSMEKDKPLVTCIIPSYNSPEIKTAIKSLLEQDYPRIELVVTDDGSKDFDVGDIEDFITKYKRENVKLVNIIVNPRNIGIVRNLNNAIKTSHGMYFINLAADDVFATTVVISGVVHLFIETQAYLIIGNARQSGKDIIFNQRDMQKYLGHDQPSKKIYNRLARGNFISGAVIYYSRDYFEQYGLFDEAYCLIEDWPTILKSVRNNVRWNYYKGVTIQYGMSGISTSKNVSEKFLEDYERVIRDEILANSYLLSPFTKRYNVFMQKYTHNKMMGESNIRNYILYPDICVYKLAKKLSSYDS